MIKGVINRHTFIQNEIEKIIEEVKIMFINQETFLNSQRHKLLRLMNRKTFAQVESLTTHEAIELIIRE